MGLTRFSQFIEEFGEAPALHNSLDEIQQGWNVLLGKLAAKYEFPPPDESVKTEDVNLDTCWVRKYTPPTSTSHDSIGVYFHGGGWALGSVDQEDALCRLLSKQCEMTLVSVEYRLAPKFKSPTPLDDCVKAVLWALTHFEASKVVLIGASAGGNLAFGTALRLIDQGMANRVQGVVALVPVTIHPNAVPEHLKSRYQSYEEHAEHTVNTKSAMLTFWDAYAAPPTDPYASCLLHPELRQLPRVYIAECGADTLRDDARLMKDALETCDVPVKYDAFPGYPHYSWTFPSTHLDEHRNDFFAKLVQAMQWIQSE